MKTPTIPVERLARLDGLRDERRAVVLALGQALREKRRVLGELDDLAGAKRQLTARINAERDAAIDEAWDAAFPRLAVEARRAVGPAVADRPAELALIFHGPDGAVKAVVPPSRAAEAAALVAGFAGREPISGIGCDHGDVGREVGGSPDCMVSGPGAPAKPCVVTTPATHPALIILRNSYTMKLSMILGRTPPG
jgi:hypothetical protein